MNKEEIKIMSYLSDSLGYGGNISEMSECINKKYGPAYYSNIYNTTKKLEKLGIILIEPEGNNKIIKLEMANPFSTYYMSEIESNKTTRITISKEILEKISDLAEKFDMLSICTLETEKYLKMNRIEILLIIRRHDEEMELTESLLQMESDYGIKIDPIILAIDEFIKIMKADEASPIKDLILNKHILYNSDGFWNMIRHHAINTNYKKLHKSPQDITREELAYNYSRFGYQLNEQIKPSMKLSLETTIFSMSVNDEIRIKYGSIILLYKNFKRINLAYLFYLYKRYDELDKFKGILLSLAGIGNLKGDSNMNFYTDLIKVKTDSLYDDKVIKKYIKLYGG